MSHAINAQLRQIVADRHLLTHPFYLRWQRGDVSRDELCAYAAQYRHFEVAFPGYLQRIVERVDDRDARELLGRNLADEIGGPVTHVELFDEFSRAIGAVAVAPTAATRALLDTYESLMAEGAAQGLVAVVAYEVQFPEVAAAKGEGLRRDHGLDRAATAFWDVHAELDADHAGWGLEALDAIGVEPAAVASSATRAADAWWAFLDEREAQRPESEEKGHSHC